MVAFWIIVAFFLFWAIPVFPWGMSREDYSPQVLLGLFLLGVCPGVTAIALLSRAIAVQRREAMVAWSSIYDRTTGLRNREFFLERLQLECDLARDRKDYRAGVILLSIDEFSGDGGKRQSASEEIFRRIGAHVGRQLRPSDLLASVSSTEMAILVSDRSENALAAIASRIGHSLEVRLNGLAGDAADRLMIEMGVASLESVGLEPEALLESARAGLAPIDSSEDKAIA